MKNSIDQLNEANARKIERVLRGYWIVPLFDQSLRTPFLSAFRNISESGQSMVDCVTLRGFFDGEFSIRAAARYLSHRDFPGLAS